LFEKEEFNDESQFLKKTNETEILSRKPSNNSDDESDFSDKDEDSSFSQDSYQSEIDDESFSEDWDFIHHQDYTPEWIEATEDFYPSSTLPRFKKGSAGLKKDISDLEEAVQFFNLLLSSTLISDFTAWTNQYAEKNRNRKRRDSHEKKWENVTDSKVKAFLGMLLLLPLVHKPRLKDYWSNQILTDTLSIKNIMSRDEFQLLKSNMRFFDDNNHDKTDVFHKVRPMINEILKNTNDIYSPPKNLSLDESMIKFNGRSKCKVYMPLKPIKFGFKVYTLTKSEEPIVLNMTIYDGQL